MMEMLSVVQLNSESEECEIPQTKTTKRVKTRDVMVRLRVQLEALGRAERETAQTCCYRAQNDSDCFSAADC